MAVILASTEMQPPPGLDAAAALQCRARAGHGYGEVEGDRPPQPAMGGI